ncbi:hypothetical protein Hypma_001790 [Hypsizygus marmoreus]|uniref:Uncharacterized protein n=1 Tax=Hypsizygus marmoreus TaxID=39966 RepID=A0A369J955_HYPMA|nr:hypothetical protein Hypma_001790 [Hypsizygus marmoreus]
MYEIEHAFYFTIYGTQAQTRWKSRLRVRPFRRSRVSSCPSTWTLLLESILLSILSLTPCSTNIKSLGNRAAFKYHANASSSFLASCGLPLPPFTWVSFHGQPSGMWFPQYIWAPRLTSSTFLEPWSMAEQHAQTIICIVEMNWVLTVDPQPGVAPTDLSDTVSFWLECLGPLDSSPSHDPRMGHRNEPKCIIAVSSAAEPGQAFQLTDRYHRHNSNLLAYWIRSTPLSVQHQLKAAICGYSFVQYLNPRPPTTPPCRFIISNPREASQSQVKISVHLGATETQRPPHRHGTPRPTKHRYHTFPPTPDQQLHLSSSPSTPSSPKTHLRTTRKASRTGSGTITRRISGGARLR